MDSTVTAELREPVSTSTRTALEQGDPATDGRAFRRCLGQYPTGVAVVTAHHGGQLLGMAVNSFASVSLDPPLVLWSIRRESSSAKAFLAAGHFAVNVLAAADVETSQLFGASHAERFARVAWQPGLHGSPLLDTAITHLECSLEAVHEAGDHLTLVGRVQHFARFEGAPLLFSQGRYAVTREHPQLEAPVQAAGGTPAVAPPAFSFMRRLRATSQSLSDSFEQHRASLGLTLPQSRLLAHMDGTPQSAETLQHATLLGDAAADDALGELQRMEQVQRDARGRYALTARGEAKRNQLTVCVQGFIEERLAPVAATDVAAFYRVLQALDTHR